MIDRCNGCRHFELRPKPETPRAGVCRQTPPRVFTFPFEEPGLTVPRTQRVGVHVQSIFPPVDGAMDWCGQFEVAK